MKNMILKGVLIGVAFYIILMIVEAMLHPQILVPAIVGCVIIAALATLFNGKNEHTIHVGEVVVLWTMVLLFVAYGCFFFFGGVAA